MAELGNVTREAGFELDGRGVHLHEQHDPAGVGAELHAQEVLDALEGDVEPKRGFLDIVAKR
jgi:hypothetical protein